MEIPLRCPDCNGGMYSVWYDVIIHILRHREWQCCKDCGFVRDVEDFKKMLSEA